MTSPDEPGLRERKRRATRRAIQRAALEVARTRGLEAVTVDEIARLADVSPRTFFNYFPSKDDAVLGLDPSGGQRQVDAFLNRPAEESALQALRAVARSQAAEMAPDTDLWPDPVWIVDSTPVECGRSRETVKRSDLAGWAQYGYCASHSRFFWGLRLHLICTLQGLPVAFALTGAKADERETLLDLLASDPGLLHGRTGQTLIGDRNYYGRAFEEELAEHGIQLLRPARKGERQRPGAHLFKPLRQVIESINETFKGQLDLEQHRGRIPGGVVARVMQRILALTAAIWHNDATGHTVLRSLTAFDH